MTALFSPASSPFQRKRFKMSILGLFDSKMSIFIQFDAIWGGFRVVICENILENIDSPRSLL